MWKKLRLESTVEGDWNNCEMIGQLQKTKLWAKGFRLVGQRSGRVCKWSLRRDYCFWTGKTSDWSCLLCLHKEPQKVIVMETISNQMQAWFTSGRLLPSIGRRRRFAGQQHPVLTKHLHIPTSSSERMAGDCLSSSSHALSSRTFLCVSLWRPRVVKDADDLFHQQSRHVGCGGSGQVTTCSVSKGSHVCWSSCFRQVKPLVWSVCHLDGCEIGYSDQPQPDEFDDLLFRFYASVVCMTYSCAAWWGKLFDLCWPGCQIHLT